MALPKSQLEKRVDALEANSGGGGGGVGLAVGDHSEIFNGYPGDSNANTIVDDGWGYNKVSNARNSLQNSQITSLFGTNHDIRGVHDLFVCGDYHKIRGAGGAFLHVCDSFIYGNQVKNYNSDETQYGGSIKFSLIGGENVYVPGSSYACVIGGCSLTITNAYYSCISGYNHKVINAYYCIIGGDSANVDDSGLRLVLGGNRSRGNVFTVNDRGNVTASGQYNTSGADYAEYFEWLDGNPDNEDRRGMLVTLDGDKLIPAHGDDFIGVVSANPSVVGNAADLYWRGKFVTDAFGGIVTDENGEPLISPEFDPAQKYIPRSERKEWAAVGLVGRLIVTDDGSCKPGSYISAREGRATKCYAKTAGRVIRRVDETHVELLVK